MTPPNATQLAQDEVGGGFAVCTTVAGALYSRQNDENPDWRFSDMGEPFEEAGPDKAVYNLTCRDREFKVTIERI